VRGFARIHETNLKKQGILPFTFANPDDYNKIQEKDRVSILGLNKLTTGQNVDAKLKHEDGSEEIISLKHSLTPEQIEWFKAGSALNLIRTPREGVLSN
jgi:aconitate hydratase